MAVGVDVCASVFTAPTGRNRQNRQTVINVQSSAAIFMYLFRYFKQRYEVDQ